MVKYTYDAWGYCFVSVLNPNAITIAYLNPFRYRSYYLDTETNLYFLKTRYYDPKIGRFMTIDDISYLDPDSINGLNLYAYCGNNPVMGYDPTGNLDLGGVIAGVFIIAGGVIAGFAIGISSPIAILVTGATVVTGIITTYAAATDSVMVVDLSCSCQFPMFVYVKGGASLVIDFKNNEANLFTHVGAGVGYSFGPSYSIGLVSNYDEASDYAGWFADVNAFGLDHGWSPNTRYSLATKATLITFPLGDGFGVGFDHYSTPTFILKW